MRSNLEVADIFRSAGSAYQAAHVGHLSLAQLKVMSAIETCRTAALGGHVEACQDCGHWRVAYNSCRNRHCPKCQGAAARIWLAEREADLLPVGYFHVVFTLPAEVADIAFLHTWGSTMPHHPHVHMIVPNGGIAPDASRWISSRPAFQRHLAPARKKRWVVYAKPPFAGPEAVLAYLSRYTHRVAISNRRLIAFDENGVTLRYKDYRRDGPERQRVMTLTANEFIRRFLLHVLPRGFHRIRHYGLLASAARHDNLALARRLLAVKPETHVPEPEAEPGTCVPCPCCGGRMIVIENFPRWSQPRAPPRPTPPIRERIA